MENEIVENSLDRLDEEFTGTVDQKLNFLKYQIDGMGISLIQNAILVELLVKKMIESKMITEEEFVAFIRSAYEELTKVRQEDSVESE